jgi:tetratricopeptide (TPR) repeat protein
MVQMNVETGANDLGPSSAAGPLQILDVWPVRSGAVPPLADRFTTRPESGPDLSLATNRGDVIALTPRARRVGAGSSHELLRCTGKTQLAVYHAESLWQARAIDLLMWVDASSRGALLASYVDTVRALTGSQPQGAAESIATSLLRWLSETDRRWLIVLDDVPDAEMLQGLWPHGPAGQLVITTANTQAVAGLRDVHVLEIGPFSPREAMSYLVGRLSSDPDQRRGAIDLIEDLGCQPLALAQATATIVSSWLTCANYRDHYYRRMAVFTSPGGPPPAAGVTWTLSVDHADQLAPGGSAQRCLAMAALLDGHGIPASVFATQAAYRYVAGQPAPAGQTVEQARIAVVALEQCGLLSTDRRTDPAIIRINPILQRTIQVAMSPEMVQQAGLAAAAGLLEAWPSPERGTWVGQALRSSAAALRRSTGGLLWTDGCHPVLLRAGQSMDDALLTGPAVDYWTDLTTVGDQVFGLAHPDSMVIVERLASAYVNAGRVPEAVAWYKRIMADWSRAFGPDHPRTLTARVKLGRVLVTARLYEDAISVLTAALNDAERAYGPGHPECAAIRNEVAAGYRAAGELSEAIRLYRLILGERERSQGGQHPDTMATRQLLADAYLADGRTKEAFSQYKKVVSDRQRSQGRDHPDTLRASAALANAYHQAGRMALAVQLYEQVHSGLDRALGSDNRETLSAALNLGRAYYSVGRLSDASTLLRETATRGERVLAPGDPLTRTARQSLALIVAD